MLETAPVQSITSRGKVEVRDLLEFALQGIEPMFDSRNNVFCNRLLRTDKGMVRDGISYRYSLMTLMGLYRAERAGFRPTIDWRSALEELGRDTKWIDNGGDLGLYLWTVAMLAPQTLKQTIASFDLEKALDNHSDMAERCTMELAWFLTGLSYIKLSNQTNLPDLRDLAFHTYGLIKKNQGPHGAFGHLSTSGSFAGKLRGRIGTFADQVYPIYAFVKFGQAYGSREALDRATQCADLICRLQGPLGQWWWHYDSISGKVTGKHPVYSVHQEAMGPMALFALSEATGQDYSEPIYKGLDWIAGDNELNLDMRDPVSHVIWRCFYQNRLKTYSNELLNFAGLPSSSAGLNVRYECRPYELGWLLYAFAGKQ